MTPFSFGPSRKEAAAELRRERSRRRAEERRRRSEERRAKRQRVLRLRRQRKEDARWRKQERKQRLREDKRVLRERRRNQKAQKRQMSRGWGSGRGRSATSMRAARNLISLATSIGVRFTEADTRALIEYADTQLAGSGEDLYTAYNRLLRLTYIGQRVRGVVEQYDVEGAAQAESTEQLSERLQSKIAGAAELLGQWQRTNSVEQATAQGVLITEVLGAAPEEIKRDQEQLERELTKDKYNEMLQATAGKSWLWMVLHPEANPRRASEIVAEDLDYETRDLAEANVAREAQAVAAEDAADLKQLSPLQRVAAWFGRLGK